MPIMGMGVTMKIFQSIRPVFVMLTAGFLFSVSCVSTPAGPGTSTGGNEDIFALVEQGRTAEVKSLFSDSNAINKKNQDGETLLHLAVRQNNTDLLQFLLGMKANTEIKNSGGESPLATAVALDFRDSARVLAKAGASVFSATVTGKTVYTNARTKGPETLESIISEATIAQQDTTGKTMLHHAADTLDAAAVALILKTGVVSVPDDEGQTPLSLVYRNPSDNASAQIASDLLLAGAEPLRGDFSYFETAVLKRNLSMRFEEGKTPLHIAAANGHTGYVNFLLERKVPVSVKDVSSSTPLHEAVRNGHIESTGALLAANADPNQKDASGNTSLHLVMPQASRSKIFMQLLAANADPNQKDSYGETPLHIAARLGMSEDIIQSLVSAGGDPNERNKKGITPLSLAIERNHLAQASLLVNLGADIHAEDMEDTSALVRAIRQGPETVQAVISANNVQSRDSQGRTALHIAVLSHAEPDVVNFLIKSGADINARDKNGDSPLHIAVRENDRANGELLLARGADVFYPNVTGDSPLRAALTRRGGREDWVLNSLVIKAADGAGNTPLHLAAEWQLDQVVSFIVDKGGSLNAKNANGETPLFSAVKADSAITVRSMLSASADRRADINARDFLGNTALHACIRWSAVNAARALIDYDARFNAKKLINARNLAGKSPLHEASRAGSVEFIRTLVLSGADVNSIDETGKTALTDAIQMNQTDAVKELLERKASPVMQDMYGRNAFHEAVEYSSVELITLLRSAGGSPMARDSFGKTPLSLSFRKSPETVLAVLGNDTNLVDSDGNTPLHIAVSEHGSAEMLSSLISGGYPVNNRNRTGSTALLLAVKSGSPENARLLLAAGADPYATDNAGESAVSIALTKNIALVEVLAEFAADKIDTIGDGILHYAARIADEETVKRLVALPRIDRVARNVAGETAFDIAVRWDRLKIAELLR